MKMNQISWNKRKLGNLEPINPEKKGAEMIVKMVKEVEEVEEEGEVPCNHTCKVSARCRDRCLECPMAQVISEPHHFPA